MLPLQPTASEPSETLGILILILPAVATAVMLFAAFGIIPLTTIGLGILVVSTIILTSILIAVEAGNLGMGSEVNGKPTTGPVSWFIGCLLLWIVVFPAYLSARSRFGVHNYLVSGGLIAIVFTVTLFFLALSGVASVPSLATSLTTSDQRTNDQTRISEPPSNPVDSKKPMPPDLANFLREGRRMVNALSAGLTYSDFQNRLPEVLASAEEASSSVDDKFMQEDIAGFTQSLLDASVLWRFSLEWDDDVIRLRWRSASEGTLPDAGFQTNLLGDRWAYDFDALKKKYSLSAGSSEYKPIVRRGGEEFLNLSRALSRIFEYSESTFRKIESDATNYR